MEHSKLSSEELIRACIESDRGAWDEFVRRFVPLIFAVVSRRARYYGQVSKPVIEDIVQDVLLKLVAKGYLNRWSHERGSVEGFIAIVATNAAADHFKAVHAGKRRPALPTAIDELPDREIRDDKAAAVLDTNVLLDELNAQLVAVASERERRVFWLYYRHGLTAKAIAAIPGIGLTAKGVESLLFRLTSTLRKNLTKAMGAEAEP